MKKQFLRITIVTTIVVSMVFLNGGFGKLFKSSTAQAVSDLSVDWRVPEGNPIFVVSNMAPSDSETRTVFVHNDASLTRPVGVRGILTSEIASLSTALSITISEGGTDLYGAVSPTGPKTLAQFFSESSEPKGIFLSNLAAESSTSYEFAVSFLPDSGNEFQNAEAIFDLLIGISIPAPDECASLNLNGDLIFGTEKNDILRGTAGGDLIFAMEGNDIVLGRGGDDCIVGGSDRDNLHGEAGSDVILGQDGDDALLGQSGNDRLFGGGGNDAMHGAGGNDDMTGGDGRDAMYGENGSDTMTGNNGNDSLHGGNNNDTIDGGTGTNAIFGGGGVDTCSNGVISGCEL